MCPPLVCTQNDIMVGLCITLAQVQPKYVTTLNGVECILEFEEHQWWMSRDVWRKWKTGWVFQYKCTAPLQDLIIWDPYLIEKTEVILHLQHQKTQEEMTSQIEGASQQVVEQLVQCSNER